MPALTGAQIAAAAQRYAGQGYVYGGNASAPGRWDCSSFVSFVLGHDLGLPLPGGGTWGSPGYPPAAHGPVVTDYASWVGAGTVGTPQAGDLCCWVGGGTSGHIGIAISPTQMISALNPTDGTRVTGIAGTGPAGSPLVYRRLAAGALAAGIPLGLTAATAGHPPLQVLLLLAGMFAGGWLLLVAAGVGGAALVAGTLRKLATR